MESIEERLDRIERKLEDVLKVLRAGGGARATAAGGDGAIDADIDGPRGDPDVRFVPKRWTGADYKGQKFSACEPEFLDMLADAYEWFAQRDDESGAVDKNGSPKGRWSRLDAARARAWSARLRGDLGGATVAAPRAARPAAPPSPRHNGSPAPSNGRAVADFGPAASTDDDIPF